MSSAGPGLLTEIGDCRARFPEPQALICLAGAAPSTRQSGKHKAVIFRWAVSKQLRDAVCDFADGSRHASPWASKIYNDAIARGKDHPHAVRILARAWLYVSWECWHNGIAYDPARHRGLQRLLATKTPAQTKPPGREQPVFQTRSNLELDTGLLIRLG